MVARPEGPDGEKLPSNDLTSSERSTRRRANMKFGIDFHKRGARTDEAIQAMRALWSEGTSSFQGKHFSFGPLHSYPKPVRKDVPIHVGGNSTAAARRAGRLGDGFFPPLMDREQLKQL